MIINIVLIALLSTLSLLHAEADQELYRGKHHHSECDVDIKGNLKVHGDAEIKGKLKVKHGIKSGECINTPGLTLKEKDKNPCCDKKNSLWVQAGQPSTLSFTDNNCTDFNVNVTPKDPIIGKWLCQFSGGPFESGRTTLLEFYVNPTGQLTVHFLAGTQNQLREWTTDDELPFETGPQENELPVTKIGPNSYTIYGQCIPFYAWDGSASAQQFTILNNRISFRIQDDNPNIAICNTMDYAPAFPVANTFLQQLIRITDDSILPKILVQDPPNADTTNPIFIFNAFFDILQTQLVQLETVINPSDYPGYPAIEAKRNFMLQNPITRQTTIVDVWRTRNPIAFQSVFPPAVPQSTSLLMENLIAYRCLRVYIEGFQREYAILNSSHAPNIDYNGIPYWKTSFMESAPTRDIRTVYTPDHYNSANQKNIVDIDVDSSMLPPYNPAVHGVATLTSQAGPVFADTEYYDLQGAVNELFASFGYMTHGRGESFLDANQIPWRLADTFSQLQTAFDNLSINGVNLYSRYVWPSHTTNIYLNVALKNNAVETGTLPANEPLGMNQQDPQWFNGDGSNFSVILQNYLDPSKTFSMYWAVDPNSPSNPNDITGNLVNYGYLNNGSSFIFATGGYNAPNPDPTIYSLDGGYKGQSVWGIVKPELSNGQTIGYIYLDDTLYFDDMFGEASLLPEVTPAGGVAGYSNQLAFYSVAMAQLNTFNPSKIIIDIRGNGGGNILYSLASFFGNDRAGFQNIFTYADNSYRGLISYQQAAATYQTVFDTLSANLPYNDITGNTTQQLYPQSVFSNGTVIILTDINAGSGGDLLPHFFLSAQANSRDLGNGVTSMIIGDIDGRLAGSESIDVSIPTNANQNTTLEGLPIESISVQLESDNTFQRNGQAPFNYYTANQTPYTDPDTLLNGDISKTAWPDLGYTSPHSLPPLSGWTQTGNVQESTNVTAVADVAQSLAGTYFFISSPTTNYVVWFKVNGSGVTPVIPGRTAVEVDLITNDSAAIVATKTATALENTGDFTILFPSSNVAQVTNRTGGTVTAPSAQTSGFTLTVVTPGANNVVGQPNPLDHDTWRDSWLEIAIAA